MFALLKKLCEAHGISGQEGFVGEILKKELEKHCEVEIDVLGNVIARKGEGKPSVMFVAHMDEIGLIVRYIEKEGFIRFAKVGGIYDAMLHSQRVIVHGKKPVYGVISSKPIHLLKEEEKKKVIEWEELFVDIGAKSEEEVRALGVDVGTPITLDRTLERLCNDMVTGKALDDRIGLAMMIEIAKKARFDGTLYFVASVQEEVGLKGARTSAFKLNPDFAIALDVWPAVDHPGVKIKAVSIGKGPVLTYYEAGGRGLVASREMNMFLEEVARKHGIQVQKAVGVGGMTDAAVIYITREGIRSTSVCVPTRYLHTPVEVLSLKDAQACVALLTHALEEWELR